MGELESRLKASPIYASTTRTRIRMAESAMSIWNRRTRLAEVVEDRIAPNLASAIKSHGAKPAQTQPADPVALAALLVARRFEEARAFIVARLAAGATAGAVMTEDLAPAARRLGALWDEDACDFVDVDIALHGLQTMLRELIPDQGARPEGRRPSILIGLAPGETHTLGVEMAERLFAAAGWRVARGRSARWLQTLGRESFGAVGFSLSCDRFAPALAQAIARARALSCNPRLHVVVGGAIFAENPGLAVSLGADGCAADASAAVQLSCGLLQGRSL